MDYDPHDRPRTALLTHVTVPARTPQAATPEELHGALAWHAQWRDNALALLRDLEWSGSAFVGDELYEACPCCGAARFSIAPGVHAPDCGLALLIPDGHTEALR